VALSRRDLLRHLLGRHASGGGGGEPGEATDCHKQVKLLELRRRSGRKIRLIQRKRRGT
jgi:hypothetical protein